MNFANINVTDSHPTEIKKPSVADIDLSELEAELRDYVIQHQVCMYVFFLSEWLKKINCFFL